MDTDAYLRRIGLARAPEPTLAGLAELAFAHLCTVPFENLDIAAGRPLSLELEALYDKIVVRRRGGFRYELNGLFAWLLRELGFDVTLLAGQVVDPESGLPGQERAHLFRPLRAGGSRTASTSRPTSCRISSRRAAGRNASPRSSRAIASALSPLRTDAARSWTTARSCGREEAAASVRLRTTRCPRSSTTSSGSETA